MKKHWALFMLGLAVFGASCIALRVGLRERERARELAAFQDLVREGGGQADATLGMIMAPSIAISKIDPETDKFVQVNRELIARVGAANVPDFLNLQREYVLLLNARSDFMMQAGRSANSELYFLKVSAGAEKGDGCHACRSANEDSSSAWHKAENVWALEQQFQTSCSSQTIICEPAFLKYKNQFAKSGFIRRPEDIRLPFFLQIIGRH